MLAAILVVTAAACTSSSPRSGGGGAGSTRVASSPDAAAAASQPNSADQMIFWLDCPGVLELTDRQLDEWRARGAAGFVCQVGRLAGLGGSHDFTPDPEASLRGPGFELQREIRATNIVGRAEARGMKLWLGVYFANYYNPATPLAEWFDDAAWSQVVAKLDDVAGAARILGFAGLAFDNELYPQESGSTASWDWSYPGNTHSEAEVRAKVRARGAEVMRGIVAAFPGVHILDYATYFPEVWEAYVQRQINGVERADTSKVHLDFWDGLTSVEGYGPIRFLNAIFYKSPQVSHATWEAAYMYEYNQLYSLLSRRLSNWAYASSRISESPFVWISAGSTRFEAARTPEYVADQLYAARRWGMDRGFAVYAYNGLDAFDYTPYLSGMRAAARPGVVDSNPPRLTVEPVEAARQLDTVAIAGSATDDLAVRVVRWTTDTGEHGAAPMVWKIERGGPDLGWRGRMDWKAAAVPIHPGKNRITVTVEDTKGLTSTRSVSVVR